MRTLLLAALLAAPRTLHASGYEFEGVGARHISRAGAAAADARDWTAVYWNPAGLAPSGGAPRELGLELFGGMVYAKDGNSLSGLAGSVFAKEDILSPFFLGAAGAAFPVAERVGLGVGFYTPLLQGSDFQDATPAGSSLSLKSSAGILATNVSAGLRLLDTLSAGLGVNLLYGKIASKASLTQPILGTTASDLSADGWGVEGLIGLLWEPHPKLSLGFAQRTGADLRLKGRADATAQFFLLPPSESADVRYDLRQPPTTDFGLAWRPADGWTLTSDLHLTWWGRFSNEFRFSPSGILLVSRPNSFNWRDTWKLRFGLSKRLTQALELLAGYSYDRHAIDASSIDLSTAIDVPMHRFSGGAAWRWSKRLETIVGAIGGKGSRREGTLGYRLSGWQLMAESRWLFQ